MDVEKSYSGDLDNIARPSCVLTNNAELSADNKLIIQKGVTVIGYSAFDGCTSLTDVYYRGTEEQWAAITISGYNECLTNATIHYNYKG